MHPLLTVGPREVEPTDCFDQHVQAHQQSKRIFTTIIVNDRSFTMIAPPFGRALYALRSSNIFFGQIPIVKNASHYNHVDLRKIIFKEITCFEPYTS